MESAKAKVNKPFRRQPKPVIVYITGDELIDVEHWTNVLVQRAESHGDSAQRLGTGMFKIYPRAVND